MKNLDIEEWVIFALGTSLTGFILLIIYTIHLDAVEPKVIEYEYGTNEMHVQGDLDRIRGEYPKWRVSGEYMRAHGDGAIRTYVLRID